jgi:hypothetical protein
VAASPANCLNCGALLDGAFCSRCGQRAIAPYPTVREMIGDAWQELSGYDGRFARTFRMLLGRPGALTIETLEGRRAPYIGPVRLYLVASVVYFVCAAAVPNLRTPAPAVMPGPGDPITIDATGRTEMSPELRDRALQRLQRAPWWAQMILRPAIVDPAAFRRRFVETLPRVLFALVPVFAAIVALFYRRRRFAQHLIFAIHLHATIFIVLTVRELSQLARSLIVLRVFEIGAAAGIVAYGLLAFRSVYGESWLRILVKWVGIAAIYSVAGVTALVVTLLWAVVIG